MGTVRTQTNGSKWSQKSARVGARERSTRALQTTCASSSTIRLQSLAARPRCRWAWPPPRSSAHRHGPAMLRARAYARYGATRRCAPIHKTDGHPGPSPVPTALAATSYTEQGAARDQPRTCTRLPPAANLRGVRREEAAGQDTRPRGDELGGGDVDGKGDEAEVVGMEAAGGGACGAVDGAICVK